MITQPIGESSKKIYTVPEGTYNGFWQHKFVFLYEGESKKIIHCIDAKTSMKGIARVKVRIKSTKAKIYEYSATIPD